MKSRFELPEDRLATTDEHGRRIYLDPDLAKGRFYRLRHHAVQPVLLVIFLVLPWVKVNGKPIILLDIPHRHFILFGGSFWAHDAPLLLFILALFTLTIAFVTSVWGRVWCGWACPQTVFIEAVFRRIERVVEGRHHSYRRESTPLTKQLVLRKTLKWILFLAVTLVISHSFLAYFVGVTELHRMILRSPSEAPGWFLFMGVVTAILLFDFGWFREQFCVIACPYGRIQSLFLDEHSKVVAYDFTRGEPRRGSAVGTVPQGDCVNCYRCVQVCPTGIDIRRGTQLECVGCTACIDACDEVMAKIKKPSGLIRHASLAAIRGKEESFFRPRIFVYLFLVVSAAAGLFIALRSHESIAIDLLRAADSPYQLIEESGEALLINHFHAVILNGEERAVSFSVTPDDSARALGVTLILAQPPSVEAGGRARADFFVKFPKALTRTGARVVKLRWSGTSDSGTSVAKEGEVTLVGPIY